MELNDLKDSLTALKYGEIATVAMIDRGAYAEIEESIEAESKDQKINSGIFKELAATVKDENEDLVGKILNGYKIFSPEVLKKKKYYVIIANVFFETEIKALLQKYGYKFREDYSSISDFLNEI